MASNMMFTIILLIIVSSITLSASSGILEPAPVTTTINYTHLQVLTTTESFLSTQPTTVFESNKSPPTTIIISSTTTETSDLTATTTQNFTSTEFSTVTNTTTATSTITFVNMTFNFQFPPEIPENQSVTVSGNLIRADGGFASNLTVVIGFTNGTILTNGVTNATGGFLLIFRAPPTPGTYALMIVFNGLMIDPYYLGARILVQNIIVYSP